MSRDEKERPLNPIRGALDRFEPGGELGRIEDLNQYEQRLKPLPADQKELAQESTRFADLCQYFFQKEMDIAPQVLGQVGRLSALTIVERIRALKAVNRELMEYLNDVGQDPGIRQ